MHPSLSIRTQCSPGANEHIYYIAVILSPTRTMTTRLSPTNPVINLQDHFYDDRLLGENISQYTVLLHGTPGEDRTEAMMRLMERVELLVRMQWRMSE
jgi:hypothetical protein